MNASYSLNLVLLSYFISVGGSFIALLTSHQAMRCNREISRKALMFSAAVALGGVGIWSMHFVGMLAFEMDIIVQYDFGLTMLSLVISIGIVFFGLLNLRHQMLSKTKLISVGFMVGLGIVAMHYTGMYAMRMPAEIVWNYPIVGGSVIIAIVASVVALWLVSNLTKVVQMIASAFVMGIAVCGMHYTGMYAATFVPKPIDDLTQTMFFSNFELAVVITIVAVAILFTIGGINIRVSAELNEKSSQAH